MTGVAHRTISSAAVAGRCRLNSSHWSGKSVKAIMPWVIELRVVSLPATASRITKKPNSSSESLWPSTSACTSLVTRSSPGWPARSAAICMPYMISSTDALIASLLANSGSSSPTIWLDQSKSFLRSSCGTPISPAMACSGSSQDTCSTKSPEPSAAAALAMSWARSSSSVAQPLDGARGERRAR